MYNEMDGNFDDVAISTFKSGLPTEHGLRKSLTASLSPMYVSLWTGLTNIKEWKRTNNKGKERRRLSLKMGRISGWTNTTITVQGEISQGNTDQPTCRRLTPYSENQYSRFWRKSRMSHSSSDRIRRLETP